MAMVPSPLQFNILFLLSALFQILPGLADDSNSENATNAEHRSSSKHSVGVGITVLLLFLGLLSVLGFSFFLYKTWQRKKRDEQQARLLKLFENDEDLEVELGIRD